jgi:hypothetical protein
MLDEQTPALDRVSQIIATGNGSRAQRMGIPKPLRAIRLKCLDCCCGSEAEVRRCAITSCALHPYRMGRYPKDPVQGQ